MTSTALRSGTIGWLLRSRPRGAVELWLPPDRHRGKGRVASLEQFRYVSNVHRGWKGPDYEVDKPIIWMGQTLKQLRAMPEDVKDEVGFALDAAQNGRTVPYAAAMKGSLRTVTEIRVDDDGDAYRTMYTTEMDGVVYVLDVFKKKSKKGIATPKADTDRILERLKRAREHFRDSGNV